MLQKWFTKLGFQLFFFSRPVLAPPPAGSVFEAVYLIVVFLKPPNRPGAGGAVLFNQMPQRMNDRTHFRSNMHYQMNDLHNK
jgi:hypothetical protein